MRKERGKQPEWAEDVDRHASHRVEDVRRDWGMNDICIVKRKEAFQEENWNMRKSWGKNEQSMWRVKEDAGRWKYLHSDLWVVGDKMKFWAERPHEQKKVDLQVHPGDKV